jgi:pimeloyl-ACP methyl ester carboxylesterase
MAAGPNFRRAYFESRYGQLHCANAFPSTGGFDERTPVFGIHDAPGTSGELESLKADLGRDRSVYALDIPGCGLSDPPPRPAELADYAAAALDVVAGLRLRSYALLGVGVGAALAAEMALAAPAAVQRLVLIAPRLSPPDQSLVAADREGKYLAALWRQAGADAAGLDADAVGRRVAERLRAGPPGYWPVMALGAWRARERLAGIGTSTLCLAESAALERLKPLLPRARFAALAAESAAAQLASPAALVAELRRFLDG